jgi:CheY-like chemotaxis protein
MSLTLVVVLLLAFALVDYGIRTALAGSRRRAEVREREATPEPEVQLELAPSVPSLQQVRPPKARARILAVDDEPVVRDSLRRILALEDCAVDTVASGPEALTLVQRYDYDFVFTDLKMPDMDGVEVVRAVKRLRPDVDLVVITGYGTIETAVETLTTGASEYLQKPFSADELATFVNRLLAKRRAREQALGLPTVRIVSPAQAEAVPEHEFAVPGGAYLAPGHTWARIEPEGQARIGIDDFARKLAGKVDRVVLPARGLNVKAGEPLFSFRRGGEELTFKAPMSGEVIGVNQELAGDPGKVLRSPYLDGWVCRIQPSRFQEDLAKLLVGQPIVAWYGQELQRWHKVASREGEPPGWAALQQLLG